MIQQTYWHRSWIQMNAVKVSICEIQGSCLTRVIRRQRRASFRRPKTGQICKIIRCFQVFENSEHLFRLWVVFPGSFMIQKTYWHRLWTHMNELRYQFANSIVQGSFFESFFWQFSVIFESSPTIIFEVIHWFLSFSVTRRAYMLQ